MTDNIKTMDDAEEMIIPPAENTEDNKKPRKRLGKRVLKIILIAVLEIALLVLGAFGGYMYAKSTIVFYDDLPFLTYQEIKETYALTDRERAQTYEQVSARNDWWTAYRHCYTVLLEKDKVNVKTSGVTDSAGIVKVSIENYKKKDGNAFYMQTASSGDTFASATTFKINASIDIESGSVKWERFNHKDVPQGIKKQSDEKFCSQFGLLPYAFCNYIINEETVTSATFGKDEESGLNTLLLILDPVESTKYLLAQMKTMSGSAASYENGMVEYTVFFEDDFTVKSISIAEKYTVNYGVIMPKCDSLMTDTYYYEGDAEYQPVTDSEKYENIGE